MNDPITVEEAAEILGTTKSWVRKLCLRENSPLDCQKWGRDWMVSRASVEAYKTSYRKPGPKPKDIPASTQPGL